MLHTRIASLLNDLGKFDQAVGAGLCAVEASPNNPSALAELGRAYFLAGNAEAALGPCAKAVTLAPHNLGAIVTFGATLFTLGQHGAALEAATKAVSLAPGHLQARVNLALALEALGRLDEAEAQARQALALDPDGATVRHNLAGLLLSRGKLGPEAWSLYEARLGLTARSQALQAIPRWRGEDVTGRTVLVHAEQGFGDVIQFVRYTSGLKERGAHVILAVPDPLLRLMQGAPGVDRVVPAGGELPAHDIVCPIASLPGLFGTTLATIPAPIPYLTTSDKRISEFRTLDSERLRVGLVWSGNQAFVHDRLRSIQAATFGVLAQVGGVEFHTLQKGGMPPFAMIDRMNEVRDFADTAELVAGLDLVISVDTAVAHLAGAMGRPVWMLSRFMGCWRWMRDGDVTPWYPTMRIFRQSRAGDWAAVMDKVCLALAERVGARSGQT